MEHPGGGESAVENTAEVAVDATFDAFEVAKDAGEMSQADAFQAMFGASVQEVFDSPDDKVEQAKNAIENRQEAMERLTSHYGGQLFQYGKYHGTISEMLDMCSAVKSTLGDGFDAVVAMIDDYKVDEIILEEDAPDEESNPNENVVSTESDEKKSEDQPKLEAEKKDEKPSTQPKKEEAVVIKETPEAEVRTNTLEKATLEAVVVPVSADSKIEKKVREDKKSEDEAGAPVEKEASETPNEPFEETVRVTPVAVEAVVVETPHEEGEVVQAKPEQAVTDTADVPTEIPTPILVQEPSIEVQTPIVPQVELVVETREEQLEATGERTELLVEEPADILEHAIEVETLSEDEPEENIELFEAESLMPEESHEEIREQKIDYQIAEIFDDWNKLAEEDEPLETLIIAMTEQLEEIAPIEQDAPEQTPENDTVFEWVAMEPNEAELEEDVRPELYILLRRVQSAKDSVERIYQAKTKEECTEYIRQLTEDLSAILVALGYDNSEAIIKQFLTSHSPEVLRGLIAELEQALRQAIQREVYQRRARSTKHRHVRLTKFVSYIMKALLPQRSAPSEA